MPIPKINSNDTYIEHLFKPTTLQIPYNGMKWFMKAKRGQRTPKGYISKAIFAEKIVKRNPVGEDFASFKTLLKNISNIL